MQNKKAVIMAVIVMILGATAFAANRVERHPKIRQAISALEAAKGDLQNAAHDFCGHRVEALEATNEAIRQLNLALASDTSMIPKAPDASLAPASSAAGAERHPLIRRAIVALEAAKADLQAAAHDFKGHRVDAIASVDRALNQLRQALACDRN